MENKKSGFGTAGLVLGIIGICTCIIPIINNASFIMGLLAIIFGIISLVKKASKGKAITALILGILSIVITLSLQSSWSNTLDNISNDLNTMSGDNTEDVLKNNVDVSFGNFEVIEEEYGFTDTKLEIKITNKSNEKKSFSIQIEAIDDNGTRIDTDTIYINNLGAGQSQTEKAFTYVSSEKIESLKKAKFNVVEVSMY